MTYDISTRELPDRPIVSIRDRIAPSELPDFIGRSFRDLYRHLGLLGVMPGGEPLVVYHAFGPEVIDAEVCVPTATPVVATGRIVAGVLKGGLVAETLHVGPYEEMHPAYAALTEWIIGHDFDTAGPVRERYLNAPGEDVPPFALRTIVEMPIAPVLVLA